jgi:hypothetical protein
MSGLSFVPSNGPLTRQTSARFGFAASQVVLVGQKLRTACALAYDSAWAIHSDDGQPFENVALAHTWSNLVSWHQLHMPEYDKPVKSDGLHDYSWETFQGEKAISFEARTIMRLQADASVDDAEALVANALEPLAI